MRTIENAVLDSRFCLQFLPGIFPCRPSKSQHKVDTPYLSGGVVSTELSGQGRNGMMVCRHECLTKDPVEIEWPIGEVGGHAKARTDSW